MWRFALPGLIIVGTLLVLLSGGLGLWDRMPPPPAEATHPSVASVTPNPAAAQSPPPVQPAAPVERPLSVQPQPPVQPPTSMRPPLSVQSTPSPPPVQAQAPQQVAAADPLQSKIDALNTQIEGRTRQLATLDAQTDSARKRLAAVQQQQQSVAASAAEQSKKLAAVRDQTQAAQQQLASLQKLQQSTAAAVKQGNDELAAIRGQIEQARQDLANAQQQQTQPQQQASTAATKELAALRGQLAQANRELAALRRQRQSEAVSQANLKPSRPSAASFPTPQPFQPQTATPLTAPSAPAPAAPAAPAQTQLASAREQLAAGRPFDARRLLSRAQSQLAFQPVTPDQPIAQGPNLAATAVGEAIHWIDLGDTGQAFQAIDRAIQLTSHGANAGYADTVGDRAAYPPGFDQRYYQQH